jgi:hypothetical protein
LIEARAYASTHGARIAKGGSGLQRRDNVGSCGWIEAIASASGLLRTCHAGIANRDPSDAPEDR